MEHNFTGFIFQVYDPIDRKSKTYRYQAVQQKEQSKLTRQDYNMK